MTCTFWDLGTVKLTHKYDRGCWAGSNKRTTLHVAYVTFRFTNISIYPVMQEHDNEVGGFPNRQTSSSIPTPLESPSFASRYSCLTNLAYRTIQCRNQYNTTQERKSAMKKERKENNYVLCCTLRVPNMKKVDLLVVMPWCGCKCKGGGESMHACKHDCEWWMVW